MARGESQSSSARPLGLASAAALVVASMVGSGVFTTSGLALADLGSPRAVLAAWAVGGVLATCGALSYGALARRIQRSGGEYAFLAAAVHPGAGFVAGWISLLAGFTAPIAAAALGFEAYLGAFAHVALPSRVAATAAIAAAALLHGARVGAGAAVQTGAVALKLALIAGFVALGVAAPPEGASLARSAAPAWSATAFAMVVVWVSYAYSGWNAAVYVAEEVREPARTLPRALLLGTGVATLAYLALNAVFLSAAPPEALAGRVDVAAVAAEAIGGAPLRRAMAGLVALALATSLSSSVMAGPRVLSTMAADGLLPRRLARSEGAPRAAMALQAALALAAVWSADLAQLLGYVGFTLGLSAAATVGALVRLRLHEGAARVPVPGWPFVPALYLAGTLGASALMALREPVVAAAGVATAAVGVPLYFVARRGVPVRRLVAPVVLAVLACVASGAGAEPAAGEATSAAREAARPAGPAPAATASFRSAEGAFAAPFPEAPRYEEAEESTLLGRLRTRSWEVERGALRLRVERHDVPSLALLVLGADTLLGRAALELLEDLGARDPHEEPASLRGHPGRHLRYEPGDRPGETEDAWLYLLGRRLYVVFARGGDAASAAAAAHFASSVELLEE